ncbi:hypothetical protein GCM10027614_15360 [Micromonospora vulcania]
MDREEIDGVQVVQRHQPGMSAASLTFGCGARDEEIDSIGLNHLVLHLVDWAELRVPDEYSDDTWTNETAFLAAGPPEQVAERLTDICAAVSDLPPDDLADAVAALKPDSRYVENIDEGLLDPWGSLLSRRYGPHGHGLSRWPAMDYGLFTADEIRRHVQRFFTTGNAVLAMTAEAPGSMRLRLPAGPRVTRGTPLVNHQIGPIWYADQVRGVALAVGAEPSAEAVLLMWALRKRVVEAVFAAGIAEHTEFVSAIVDSTRHELGLRVVPEHGRKGKNFDAAVAAELLWAELRRLVDDGLDRAEIADLLPTEDVETPAALEPIFERTDWMRPIQQLEPVIHRELFGTGEHRLSDSPAELAELSPAAARDVLSGWLSSAMIVVPYESTPNLPGATEKPCPSTRFVPAGEVVRPTFRKRFGNKGSLVIGTDAISTVDGDGNVHTVPLSEALVAERYGGSGSPTSATAASPTSRTSRTPPTSSGPSCRHAGSGEPPAG